MKPNLIGRKIKQLREGRGLTQYDFGKKIGLPPQHISMYENAAMEPRVKTLLKMIRVFKLPPAYFFVESDYHGSNKDAVPV